ncbi:MAG TPA: hypothetical protein PLR54_04795, partial [Spirochaetota bacterium]|nr:hypothetical protein [Spirochaetota bacterium]HQK06965.1 hypothetical protein [Spirochaetota bacterium]
IINLLCLPFSLTPVPAIVDSSKFNKKNIILCAPLKIRFFTIHTNNKPDLCTICAYKRTSTIYLLEVSP